MAQFPLMSKSRKIHRMVMEHEAEQPAGQRRRRRRRRRGSEGSNAGEEGDEQTEIEEAEEEESKN